MIILLLSLLRFILAHERCGVDACTQGINILQYDTSLPVGPNNGQFSYLPNAANGTIVNSGIFCTSASVCFLESNSLFEVPGCGRTIQLSTSMFFQEQLISGTVDSLLGFAEDPFYGFGSFGFLDPHNGWTFEFRITRNLTYAAYGKIEDYETDCKSYLYLIPLAHNINGGNPCEKYDIVLDACEQTISWRLGNTELLRIKLGEQIDERFRVYGAPSNLPDCGCSKSKIRFPCSVKVKLGNGSLQALDCCSYNSQAACQQAIFQECFDFISNACRVNCKYSNITFDDAVFGLGSIYKNIAVLATKNIITCGNNPCSDTSSTDSSSSSLPCAAREACRFEQQQRN